uniref:Uncharacterized protein n=1 Tax=Anguilla anguilla TaxID=7936 RepID=A0A0E9QJW9_ANGAN
MLDLCCEWDPVLVLDLYLWCEWDLVLVTGSLL